MFKIYKEKYVVYDNGDVYIIGTKEVRKLKPWVTNSGYKQVNINRKAEYLHRVIIEAFRGKSDMQVDHIDGNKNNKAEDTRTNKKETIFKKRCKAIVKNLQKDIKNSLRQNLKLQNYTENGGFEPPRQLPDLTI